MQKDPEDVILYANLAKSFDAKLEEYRLLFKFDLALNTPVTDIINMLANAMEDSDFNWSFAPSPRNIAIFESERAPLQLLQVHNRGNHIRGLRWLRRFQHYPEMTVKDLGADRLKFSHSSCVSDNRFIVHFIIRSSGSTVMTSLSESDDHARLHTCISRKVYHMFPTDNVASIPDDDVSSEENDDDDDELEVHRQFGSVSRSLRRRPLRQASRQASSLVAPSPRPDTPALPSSNLRPNLTNSLQRAPSLPSLSELPPVLWQVPFVPIRGKYAGVLGAQSLLEDAYDLATEGVTVVGLDLYGTSVSDLAATFKTRIAAAVKANDFTEILSPERLCAM